IEFDAPMAAFRAALRRIDCRVLAVRRGRIDSPRQCALRRTSQGFECQLARTRPDLPASRATRSCLRNVSAFTARCADNGAALLPRPGFRTATPEPEGCGGVRIHCAPRSQLSRLTRAP